MPRFLTAGESHGRGLVALIESFPAGIDISIDGINEQMRRRQLGFGRGQRMKIESDKVIIQSGVRHGKTLGSPIAMLIENKDWANWQKIMHPQKPIPTKLTPMQYRRAYDTTTPRPGHADLSGAFKYDTHDLRNVLERASARETAARVACGAVARQLLDQFNIEIASHVISIGKAKLTRKKTTIQEILDMADDSPVRCIDKNTESKMIAEIKNAAKKKDTLGGIFEVRIAGLPIGLGNNAQWYQRLDGLLAGAIMSIQSVKGVEIGDAFAAAQKFGSVVHDSIYYDSRRADQAKYYRKTNTAGGIEGGMTNGADIIIRAACKPISTLMQPLESVDVKTKQAANAMVERSDICVVPAAGVVGEAMAAMVIANAFLDKFGGDSKNEVMSNYMSYMGRVF
ncbi:MAG: chorismate synthase [Candidatus Zixiibacteriota bacterium]